MLDSLTHRVALGLAVAACLALTAGTAVADKCTAAKLKAIGKKESGLLACQAKVATKGDPSLQAACDAKVLGKFATAFAKAGTCPGMQSDCEAIADDCRDQIRAALPDGTTAATASKCESARLKAAGKKASSKLGCYAKAATKEAAVDSAPGGCLDKANGRFVKAFDKVTGCTGDGQDGAVETRIDDECVGQQVVVDGGGHVIGICPTTTTTTTTTTSTSTTTTTILCGNNSVDPGEQCDPPGSSCGGSAVCQFDCTCPCDPSGCPCDFLDPSVCLYPFPSDFFTVPDASTDTGKRVNFTTVAMPKNTSGQSMNASDYNLNDGFSPGVTILTRVPGVDLAMTGAAPITDIARSLDSTAPVVLVNASTLAHHLMFVELDANATTAANRSLIIHPSVNLDEATRYIVALRNMKDSSGTVLTPNADFLAYRDNIPTGDPVKEGRRAHMEDIFTTLASAGVARSDLYLAWDFTVASRRSLTERMLFVRDDGFARLGTSAPPFTVTNVFEHACSTGTNPYGACSTDADCTVTGGGMGTCNTASDGVDTRIFRRVVGTYDVERYVDSTTPPAKFVLDANGLPTHQATPQPASFVCNIPRMALPSAAGPAVPARASIYGHGLLGSNTEVSSGNVEDMANEHNFVFCATKWIGMSNEDVGNAIAILQNLAKFPSLTDRLQQAMLDQLFLARLMIHPAGFVANPAFQDSGANPVIDTSDVFFDGNSQGGIFGGTIMAIAQDITRGVLGVPGMNYSLLLTRSSDFALYSMFLYPAYPQQLQRPLLLALIQMLWDRSDPNGYAHHITSDPLPSTPAHKVLLHEAFGDHQVANVATEIEARTLGLSIHQPAIASGRSYEVTPYYGIPAIPTDPFDGSALIVWDSGANTPPTTNTAPSTGPDPHSDPRNSPNARTQKSDFLQTGGAVVDVCSGAPCVAP